MPTNYVLSQNIKDIRICLSENVKFLEVKFSMYLNRRVFVLHIYIFIYISLFWRIFASP